MCKTEKSLTQVRYVRYNQPVTDVEQLVMVLCTCIGVIIETTCLEQMSHGVGRVPHETL